MFKEMTDVGLETIQTIQTRVNSIRTKSKFLSNDDASAGLFIEVAIAVIIASALIPTAITNWFGANTSTWDDATVAVYLIAPVIIVAVVVLILYNRYGKGAGGGGGGGRKKGGF